MIFAKFVYSLASTIGMFAFFAPSMVFADLLPPDQSRKTITLTGTDADNLFKTLGVNTGVPEDGKIVRKYRTKNDALFIRCEARSLRLPADLCTVTVRDVEAQ